MQYFKPDKAVPFVIDSCTELLETIKRDRIDINVLEKTFIDIFLFNDKYDPTLVVQGLRLLYQSACAAQNEISRKDFDSLREQERLRKEYTYMDAASELGIGYSTIKLLVKANRIAVKKYSSKNIRITQAEIDRYKENKV
jgi:hypothetical protein